MNDGWQFSETGKNQWKDAIVPGSVQRDLIRLGVLPDPYWGSNEKLVQWVEDKNWDFRKSFTLTDEQLSCDEVLITFKGLDTYADVFLNGSKIIHAENMFLGYEVPVKNILKKGENQLYIRFFSPIEAMLPAYITSGFDYPADNDHRLPRMSVYTRKAPYHYGWDWGIRMVQTGIWRPVELTFFNQARITDYWVQQLEIEKNTAKLNNQLEVYSLSEKPVNAILTIDYNPLILSREPQQILQEIILTKGENTISIPLGNKEPNTLDANGLG